MARQSLASEQQRRLSSEQQASAEIKALQLAQTEAMQVISENKEQHEISLTVATRQLKAELEMKHQQQIEEVNIAKAKLEGGYKQSEQEKEKLRDWLGELERTTSDKMEDLERSVMQGQQQEQSIELDRLQVTSGEPSVHCCLHCNR